LKDQHRDAVLFFRLGDFYEMFRSDAVEASRILGLTLTQRSGVPMCGIPHHAAAGYIARLIHAGKKVAICEQTKLPAGGGLAEREIVNVVTPGTLVEEDLLDRSSNNYLLSLAAHATEMSLVYTDLSTGELSGTVYPLDGAPLYLRAELTRLRPREVLVQESLLSDYPQIKDVLTESDRLLNSYPDWNYNLAESRKSLERVLGVVSLKGFGIPENSILPLACGVLIEYLRATSGSDLSHIRSLQQYSRQDHVQLDDATLRNLELLTNMHDGTSNYTLRRTLDFCRTAMGSRMLARWIGAPSTNMELVVDRQENIAQLYHGQMLLSSVREELGRVLDLERLASRVAMERAHAKDLVAIAGSLEGILRLQELSADHLSDSSLPIKNAEDMSQVSTIATHLRGALLDEPAVTIHEGGIFRDGFDLELDRLRALSHDGARYLEEYLARERATTGIPSLKVKHNRVLGYYLETTKSGASSVPDHFIRRQSLSNAERFTTEELAELEESITGAEEGSNERERELFLTLRDRCVPAIPLFLACAERTARLDCLASLALAATRNGYVRPQLIEEPILEIQSGRHPVVERHTGSFVPNNLLLGGKSPLFRLVTGPNMAGKSTFLRQTALIVLMAQMGSFVPAEAARIGLVDRVFCRVGAQDNLARGESTFLVEMSETAAILRNAGLRSLVIMDEVGRGTGTTDGLAIATAVTEYLLNKVGARTLFATHFHELTAMRSPQLGNLSLEVAESGGELIFRKRVVEGPSEQSYGVHVAALAGIPLAVVRRAEQLLEQAHEDTAHTDLTWRNTPIKTAHTATTELFSAQELLISEISSLSVENLTPLEALTKLAEWQKRLQS
ncbi:MAG: DNA mismatch repair protein MutS, partial [Spirochaetia bacterium]